MTYSQAYYEKHSNTSRRPAPAYQVGDLVWLDTRNWMTERPAKKLDQKNAGPFKVTRVINPQAYQLDLPEQMRIHNVFHTSLLRPVAPDSMALPGQAELRQPPPPQVIKRDETEEDEYEVENIVDSRLHYKKLQYKVKWEGHQADWRSWKDVLPGCDELVKRFHEMHPDKLGPPEEYDMEQGKEKPARCK